MALKQPSVLTPAPRTSWATVGKSPASLGLSVLLSKPKGVELENVQVSFSFEIS